MTSEFDDCKQNQASSAENLETTDLTMDCFELLSAYIDGELSPNKRHQVQTWLDQDPKIKRVYTQLLILQGHLQHSVAPKSEKSVSEITAGVFNSIRRRRHRQMILCGSALAASLLALFSGFSSVITPSSLKMAANKTSNNNSSSVMLAVAINKPAINIPETANGYIVEFKTLEN
ncbi:hypothetical protein NIES4102_15940 [Chondrocystis sp. NIES-4102]|nr:hypothetical protein NIES4102_15940 [Chondrocystis sp. NIES-4102]